MRISAIDAIGRRVIALGVLGAAAVIVTADARPAAAQNPFGNNTFGIPASRQINNPPVSPFLNLAQPGINPGVAYQTLVAPQMQLGNALVQQQQQIGMLQQDLAATRVAPQVPVVPDLATGHRTYFLDTLGYFPLPSNRRR